MTLLYPDRIFGQLLEPDQRIQRHHADRSGVKHLQRVQPADPLPGQPITLTVTTSGPTPFDLVRVWFTTRDDGPKAALDLHPARTEWDTLEWEYVTVWEGELPAQPAGTMLRYHLGARLSVQAGDAEAWIFADTQAGERARATEFAVWVDDDPAPGWARDAVVYHIFVDRFYPGDGKPWQTPTSLSGFFGGTLRGVTQKLDYIRDLGFTALWLSPLFASPSHHGYDATDYYSVEPRLGTAADLDDLMAQAHARGLRVILDFVANHWSHLHPTFQDAQARADSAYHDWYKWNEWPEYETYFGVRELPELNLKRGPARDYLLECAAYWLRRGVDGFRLDYAYGPPHDFWSDFRRACRAARPDAWLFGEVINTPDLLATYAGRMDGVLDFMLARALRETFGHGAWDLAQFESFLSGHQAYYPEGLGRPAFLDNHDMNRFLFISGNDPARLKLAALALFTLPGAPIVYNGAEVGVTQERPIHQNDFGIFEEARLPMKWGAAQDAGLHAYFRRLIHLRRAHPVLATGARRVVHLEASAGTYAYLRTDSTGRALAAFNLSNTPRRVRLPLTGFAEDRLNGCPVQAQDGGVEIELPPQTGALLV